ncbi:alpha/beta hydrolase [Antribacter gilvus]|uniref:alpha/beta hydrolase n=1 Tax=Antribacter gilvus TaxID=2304675 RepID=UPI000F771C90|nr:alpha/beta fold hydrolase [Antribacter gilvus]
MAAPRGAVLHVHGYNDYFFQAHLAHAFAEAGYAFYAVDLRTAGRSLKPGQIPHYVTDLRQQAADIDVAAHAIRAIEQGPLTVHAHSTGGLTAALWAHDHRADGTGPDALVLEGPFLDLSATWWQRTVGTWLLQLAGRLQPLKVLSSSPSHYATAQLAANGGRWEFDTTLKRPEGVPARQGWMRSARRGHAQVRRGLGLTCPVLVAYSAESGPDDPANPLLDAQDTILDVRQIAAQAPRLGADVTQLVVEGAVHDLTLSDDEPRAAYLAGMLGWLEGKL